MVGVGAGSDKGSLRGVATVAGAEIRRRRFGLDRAIESATSFTSLRDSTHENTDDPFPLEPRVARCPHRTRRDPD